MPDIVFMDGDGNEIKKSIYEIDSIDDIENAFIELGVIKKRKKNVRKKK
tara:strand:- start:300 stop:446 length:147 start_codon:yes stop_codon:yes gene_type:complete